MTDYTKINWVKRLLQNDPQATDDVIAGYLEMASERILLAMYPLGIPEDSYCLVPEKYHSVQCELAARYFSRRGGLGEQIHNENGIHRHYGTTTDIDLLRFVTPMAKVM